MQWWRQHADVTNDDWVMAATTSSVGQWQLDLLPHHSKMLGAAALLLLRAYAAAAADGGGAGVDDNDATILSLEVAPIASSSLR